MTDDVIYILDDEKNGSDEEPSKRTGFVPKPPDDVLNVLKNALSCNASDIHLQVGSQPIFRIDGILTPFKQGKRITSGFMAGCSDVFLSKDQKEHLFENRQVDCSVTLPSFAHRFRINFFYQRNHLSGVFRVNPTNPPTMEQLGLPPLMEKLVTLPNGLVLITGATGCGKTTTLAAIVHHMNHHRNAHIITLSDPTEYLHKNKCCVISQREIGTDATSFASALRVALREDPNVLVVEEVRDLESISMALTAAETGHLVFATLHTNDAVQAIDRLIDVFPPNQQSQIRVQLSMTLQAVISQVLLKRKGGPGRVAVFETMPITFPIRNMIRENQTVQIYSIMELGRAQGMLLRNDALKEAVRKGLITQEDAEAHLLDNSTLKRDHTS